MSKQEEIKQLLSDRAKFTERMESTKSYNLTHSSVARLQSIDERIALLAPGLLEENERLRKELEEEKEHCTKAIRLLMQVTDTLSIGRTPDRAGAALKQIYKWLNENHPVGQEGEVNQDE